jgi:uncharacterized membrane protein YiaA
MWEIYAYQNADSLFGIFNAAAAIHGSGDYMAAVAAVAFCGFISALVAYAFAPEKLQGWKWLATVLLVFSVLIVPRVTVGVVDKTGGSAVKVVANVPFGVAFLGSVTSTVGHTLTGLFETAFQVIPGVGALPSELSYEKNGLMFGNRLIRETGGVAFQDPNFRTDLRSSRQGTGGTVRPHRTVEPSRLPSRAMQPPHAAMKTAVCQLSPAHGLSVHCAPGRTRCGGALRVSAPCQPSRRSAGCHRRWSRPWASRWPAWPTARPCRSGTSSGLPSC